MLGQFGIYEKEGYETGRDSVENINARISGDFDGKLTEEYMDALMKQLSEMGASAGFKIISNELKTFDREPIIYYESEIKLSDELLDILVEEGTITEADIEAAGERDLLINTPEAKQIGVTAVIDGKAITITGTYNEKPDEILEAVKLCLRQEKLKHYNFTGK